MMQSIISANPVLHLTLNVPHIAAPNGVAATIPIAKVVKYGIRDTALALFNVTIALR